MGFFDKLFGFSKTTEDEPQYSAVPEVKEEPAKTANPMVIDMSKHAENLNKVLIDMSKDSKIDMSKHIARVALAMDYSGSMSTLFNNGSVQETITRLLPIALKFDDNGELESWLFSDSYDRLDAVTINNYKKYVRNVMFESRMSMGGTNYAPVLRNIVQYYKDIEPSEIPAYIIFITDGENWDERETDKIIRELSKYNMFVQFVGIGNESFSYLRKLDNLSGRQSDNTGFTAVKDMNRMSDTELYNELLRQYVAWLNKK